MKAKYRRIAALVLAFAGIGILILTLFPIVKYLSVSKQKFPDLLSPLARDEQDETKIDYTKASNWFEGSSKESFESSEIKFYTISIPSLKIKDASVAVGGEDLSESLIHYPQTALPGKIGNSVIFGHSALPIFFDPNDYLTIFSTLPKLEKGDEILVNYDGILYKYMVENMFEVTPADIQILEQNSDAPYLTLVTCTPPGDPRKPKRLIVRAKLVPNT